MIDLSFIFPDTPGNDGYDLRLPGEQWSPANNNYISLGEESVAFDRLEIRKEYENVLRNEITNSKCSLKSVRIADKATAY